jgi:DNA-binding GntR family transcriptional regulator
MTSAQERAYNSLKNQLMSEQFPEGHFLSEGTLAETLGISRTPVREALRRLHTEKLIEIIPGRGAFVPRVDERTMREVMVLRELFETHAVGELRDRIPAELIRRLDQHMANQRNPGEDVEAFIKEDRYFHQAIVDSAGNKMMSEIYAGMRDRQTRIGLRAILSEEARHQRVLEEHATIVDSLRRGDIDGAVTATRVHLRNTRSAWSEGRL